MKTRNFVTFYEFLPYIGLHHTKSRGNNTTTGNNNDGQHKQQSNRMWYRLGEEGGGNGEDSGLGKCKGTTVDTVGRMATTRGGRGQS